MRVKLVVEGLPPKKDGANSMWRKGSELARLEALRLAAAGVMADQGLFSSHVDLRIVLYAPREVGDLDAFIGGICDGLMPAHANTPVAESHWCDVSAVAHPSKAIAFLDDTIVERIEAERRSAGDTGQRYEVEIIGE